MDRFVGEAFRLLHYRDPTGGLDRTERIEVPVLLEMPDLVLADLLDQHATFGGGRAGVWLKIIREKRNAVLIEHLEQEPIGEFDRGQASANSFHEDRVTNVAEDRPVGRAHCGHDIGDQTLVRQSWMHWRNNCFVRSGRLLAPVTGPEVLTDHLWRGRD